MRVHDTDFSARIAIRNMFLGDKNREVGDGIFHTGKCESIAGKPPSVARAMEQSEAFKDTLRQLGVQILNTYSDDVASPLRAHSYNFTKIGKQGVDCTHWWMPGVPDTWATKLIALLL